MRQFLRITLLLLALFVFGPIWSSASIAGESTKASVKSLDRLRVGLFPGTLDPAHNSHTGLVAFAVNKFNLDIVYILPNLSSPHKPLATSYALRKEMARAAFSDLKEARFPDVELEEVYKDWDIMAVVSRLMERHPTGDIYHLMGSDTITRYGDSFKEEFAGEAGDLVQRYKMVINIREQGDEKFVPKSYGLVELLPMFLNKKMVSSTDIRDAMVAGKVPAGVSSSVFEIMKREGLYLLKAKKEKCEALLENKPVK